MHDISRLELFQNWSCEEWLNNFNIFSYKCDYIERKFKKCSFEKQTMTSLENERNDNSMYE